MTTMTITLSDPDTGDDFEVQLPSKKAVCPTCEGHGKHLHPSIRDHAYTQEEFNEAYDDEQRQEYFKRGGIYDVVCQECKGTNVIDEVDEERLTPEQREHYESYLESARLDAEYEAMCRAERDMGC